MAAKIPLVLVLWQDINFGGSKRVFVSDDRNLSGNQSDNNVDFNDKASAVGVHAGPDFNAAENLTISLFSDAQFGGKELVLGEGIYPNLKNMDFNDCVSSVRFNGQGYKPPGLYVNGKSQGGLAAAGPAGTIASIPAIVQLYVPHGNRQGGPGSPSIETYRVVTMVEPSADIGIEYDSQFSGMAKFAKVVPGPSASALVRLYRLPDPDSPQGYLQGGGHIDLAPRPGTTGLDDLTGIYALEDYGFVAEARAVGIEGRSSQGGVKTDETIARR